MANADSLSFGYGHGPYHFGFKQFFGHGYGHRGWGHKGYGHRGYGHRGYGYKGHGYRGHGGTGCLCLVSGQYDCGFIP